jgi:hypothetical protein
LFDVVVRYDLSTVAALQEDQAARVERTITAWNAGIMTRNEARRALALPIDDAGDVYALPTSVQLLDVQHSPVIGMPTLTPTPAPAPTDDTPVETRDAIPMIELRAPARAPHPVADYVPPPIDDVAESMFRRLRRYVNDQYRTAAQEIDAIAARRAADEQARNV